MGYEKTKKAITKSIRKTPLEHPRKTLLSSFTLKNIPNKKNDFMKKVQESICETILGIYGHGKPQQKENIILDMPLYFY